MPGPDVARSEFHQFDASEQRNHPGSRRLLTSDLEFTAISRRSNEQRTDYERGGLTVSTHCTALYFAFTIVQPSTNGFSDGDGSLMLVRVVTVLDISEDLITPFQRI